MSYPVNKLHHIDKSQLPAGFHILSPVNGILTPISQLSNTIINSGCLGEGVAIAITGNKLHAPFDGVVTQMPATGERIVLQATNGIKLVLLFAHNNQQLMGKGFNAKVTSNSPIKKGQVIATFNLQQLQQLSPQGPHYLAAMIVNAELVGNIYHCNHKLSGGEDILLTVTAKKNQPKPKAPKIS